MAAAVNWEFSVSINHTEGDRYYLKVENVPAGGILAEAQVSWAVEDWLDRTRQLMNDPLQDILQGRDVGVPRPGSLPDNAKFAPNLVDLGQELYDALFQGTIRDSWLMAQAIAQHYRSVLRLRIGLRGATLPRLPWEVMHYWNCPLAATTDITFSRYQILSRASISPRNSSQTPALPLRILMVIAAPGDQESLELRREAEHLRSELQERTETPLLDLTILEQPGREELTYALEHGNYHIFHFSGHSNLGANGGNLFLVNNQNGLTETLSGNDLAGLLSNNGVQLVVFNSCRGVYTAASEVTTTTGNLTQSIVNRGVPAVLAMSERIPDNVALTLTRLFYRNLNQGYPIDLSLSRARQGLISTYGSHQLYWALPVLYLHPEFDGFLWRTNALVADLKQVWALPQEDSGVFGSELRGLPGIISGVEQGIDRPLILGNPGNLSNLRSLNPLAKTDPADRSEAEQSGNLDNSDLPLIAPEEMQRFFRHSQETVTFDDQKSSQKSNQKSSQKSNQKPNTPPPALNSPLGKSLTTESTDQTQPPSPVPLVTRSPQTLVKASKQTPANTSAKSSNKSARSAKSSPAVGMAWLSTFILLGAVAAAGGWWYFQHSQQQISAEVAKIAPAVPIPVPTVNPKDINLKTADIATIVTLGSQNFKNSDLGAGRLAVEELLDRLAFKEAQTALSAVNLAQTEDANINFLRGRLAWQAIKTGNKDFTLEDVRKFWDSASKNQPTSVFYYNALGFSYYETGDFSKAKDAWLAALKILEANPGITAQPQPDPVSPRDRFNTYAGLALVFNQLSDNLLRTERNRLLTESQSFYQLVMKEDGANYQPEVLGKNWLWSDKAIRDWTALGKK